MKKYDILTAKNKSVFTNIVYYLQNIYSRFIKNALGNVFISWFFLYNEAKIFFFKVTPEQNTFQV